MDPQNLEAGLLKGKSRSDEHEQLEAATQTHTHPSEFFKRHGKTELEVFQTLVGIHFLDYGGGGIAGRQKPPAGVMDDIFRPSKAAKARFRNRGLYDRCISQDMKNRVMYGLSNYLISILYIFQVLLAAAVTALSAYKESHVIALTTLAAINTVVAGILAWLTGQGMPSRFRRARDQYREVVHAIEAAERMFAEIDFIDWPKGERPNPIAERERLEKLYNEARLDQQSNYPDSSQSPSEEQQKEKEHAMDKKLAKEKEKVQQQCREIEALQRSINICGRKERTGFRSHNLRNRPTRMLSIEEAEPQQSLDRPFVNAVAFPSMEETLLSTVVLTLAYKTDSPVAAVSNVGIVVFCELSARE